MLLEVRRMPLIETKRYVEEEKKRLSLSLVVTRSCNLNCSYCYENKYDRSKEQMDISVAKDVITYYMERDDGHKKVSIEFFGGEPLLGFSLIKEVVEWFYSRSWKKDAFFGIQTNGTLLTEEMKEWLVKYKKKLTVGFSIDGCKEAHDLNRSNSYDLLYSNIPFLKKNWPHQPAKMTVNDRTIPYISESVIHLEDLSLNFNGGLVLEDIWGDNERKKKLLETYEEQLAILLNFYEKRPHLYPPSPLFSKIPEYIGRPGSEIEQLKKESLRFCGAGHEMATVDVDGTIYPCHRFLPFCTGRPLPDKQVNTHTQWRPDTCAECTLVASCPTCVGLNYQENGDAAIRTTYHCDAFKLGILASCKLEAVRLNQMTESEFAKLSEEEKGNRIRRLDAIIHIIENGI
jgi:radical SAM protein with 4Fe4S-binding SPASM domain